ncbi:unnamed protein product [Linum tenue]|uniref:Uncharacterized protein n=1 Tax=Linum tenue TaxID=586396 RepID=A0AAV0LCB6_9ROSI|nr:unnamed protein product [Linum tenue]
MKIIVGATIVVTGDGIDSAVLVTLLRNKVGHAELVSLGPVEEKKKEDKKAEEDSKPPPPSAAVWSYGTPVARLTMSTK